MPGSSSRSASSYQHPAELLQGLIHLSTTNPPGNEAACITYISELFTSAGIQTTVLVRAKVQENAIARQKGDENAPSL